MLLLIHPQSGTALSASDRSEFEALVLDGFRPVGPRGQRLADEVIRAQLERDLGDEPSPSELTTH